MPALETAANSLKIISTNIFRMKRLLIKMNFLLRRKRRSIILPNQGL